MRLPAGQRGFTLVELLISSTLAAVVMAAILSSYLYLGRNLTRLAYNQTLESKSRLALTYLANDIKQATSVSSPTTTSVILNVPGGTITYTYDATNRRLRRQATTGAVADTYLLYTGGQTSGQVRIDCPAFTFSYYTTTNGSPTYQSTSTLVPYSIKMIGVAFTVRSSGSSAASTAAAQGTLTQMDTASARFVLRNRTVPTGT
ncbi:MAG: prepilin-type N-terminal cleavage/methylation domain-containing protein [Opitutaceae bacterium]|nr:prepilin-type N-terminal cleavage/methylation domain-containing protein [Opitutaceae bacterium]